MVNRCYLCKNAEESCNHILLWCPIFYSIWSMVYGMMGLNCAIAGSVRRNYGFGRVCVKRKNYYG